MKLNLSSDALKSLWLHNPIVRVFTVALGIIPVFLIYNSLMNRLPIIVSITNEINSIQPLFAKVEKKRLLWSTEKEQSLRDELLEAKSDMPANYKSLLKFVKKLDDAARLKGFKLNFSIGKAEPVSELVSGLSNIPISIRLFPDDDNAGTIDFLKMLKAISDNNSGIKVADIKVVGSGEKVNAIEARLIVMVGFSG